MANVPQKFSIYQNGARWYVRKQYHPGKVRTMSTSYPDALTAAQAARRFASDYRDTRGRVLPLVQVPDAWLSTVRMAASIEAVTA